MGVKYLAKFVAKNENAQNASTSQHLRDIRIVIDGCNILNALYEGSRAKAAYGGDYDVFAQGVANFCGWLESRKITPYFVFDGASDVADLKFHTLTTGAKERLQQSNLSTQRKETGILPCLAYRTFIEKLRELEVPYCVCDHEADSQLASLAREWNCPLVSNDSDFLLYDLPGGVITVKELDVSKIISFSSQSSPSVLPDEVRIFYNSKLMELYGIKDHAVLTVLSVICGNDIFDAGKLQGFRTTEKLQERRFTDIDKILKWLAKQDTVEQVINNAVETQGGPDPEVMKREISDTISTYQLQSTENQLSNYFHTKQITHHGNLTLYVILPDEWWRKYRQAVIPKKMLDILMFHRRIFSPQLEKLTYPSAWRCSLTIRIRTYKILSASSVEPITSIEEHDRKGNQLSCSTVSVSQTDLPALKLCVLYEKDIEERLRMFYGWLGLTEADIERGVVNPQCTQRRDTDILTAILIHWINNAKPHVFKIHLAALLVCIVKDLSLNDTDLQETTAGYCSRPPLDKENRESLEIDTIHAMAQFQAVLSDSLDLLGLLCIDTGIRVHHIFNGKLIYNLCVELMKLTKLPPYCKDLLSTDSNQPRKLFKSMYKVILDKVNPDYLKEVENYEPSERNQGARRRDTDDSRRGQLVGNRFAALTLD